VLIDWKYVFYSQTLSFVSCFFCFHYYITTALAALASCLHCVPAPCLVPLCPSLFFCYFHHQPYLAIVAIAAITITYHPLFIIYYMCLVLMPTFESYCCISIMYYTICLTKRTVLNLNGKRAQKKAKKGSRQHIFSYTIVQQESQLRVLSTKREREQRNWTTAICFIYSLDSLTQRQRRMGMVKTKSKSLSKYI
jgi:hypothetical protein